MTWSLTVLLATVAETFGAIIPPVHIGETNPETEGFTGDGVPITGAAAGGFRRIVFKGVQRYRVNLDAMPGVWTMTVRGSVDYVETHGLGVAVSIGRGMAVCIQWPDTKQVTDLETSVTLDATQLHTYQIVYDGVAASLWIDGVRSIERMTVRRADSIGVDTLSGFWIGSFSSRGASQSAWNLWKLDEGIRIVSKTAEPTASQSEAISIGSRLELFVDDFLIEKMTGGITLKLHEPVPRETVLRFDKPWEGRWSGYVTVLPDDDRFRMYYRAGLDEKPRIDDPESVCYAESTDGIHWTKPELGLYEFDGTDRTNIVWRGNGSHCGLGVFKDTNPNAKPDERYKALSGNGYQKPVWAFGSPDGIRWHLIQEDPVLTEYRGVAAAYDSHFCTRWDPTAKRYVTYHRIWYRPFGPKVRSVALRTSDDFIQWTPLRRLDFGSTAPEHIYTNGITPYARAPHILLGFPRRFLPGRKRYVDEKLLPGVSDTCFISSRDGIHFSRRFMESYLRPGRDRLGWLSRSNTVAPGMIETASDEISLYVSHGWADPAQHIRRYVIRKDGFVSAHAKYESGELLTKPITFTGNELVINYATSAAGRLRVEIQDVVGNAIPGFALEDCPVIFGDDIERTVSWQHTTNIGALAEIPVRLRFVMKDADLFSIRFVR
ncbi:MAG: hypothetical protein MK102_07510 [Fuerstiella sp.]|nr:hypothetical protein [Fuerstiella sp.]